MIPVLYRSQYNSATSYANLPEGVLSISDYTELIDILKK